MGRMTIGSIVAKATDDPHRVVLYGVEGVGKSTWAAAWPSPVFLSREDGHGRLRLPNGAPVPAFPEPHTWGEVKEAVTALTREEHKHKTLVLDTVDWLEPLCWAQICDSVSPKKSSIEDFGYGKGYLAAVDEWRVLLASLDVLRRVKGMNVVMLAHGEVRSFKNPEGDDYERFELACNKKLSGLVKQWADGVYFANYLTLVDTKDGRTRGVSKGERVMWTERRAAYDAKNRFGLPQRLPLEYPAYAQACLLGASDPDTLRQRIRAALERVTNTDEAAKVAAAIDRAGNDPGKLGVLLGLANNLAEQNEETKS